jgi:hypothetical protein
MSEEEIVPELNDMEEIKLKLEDINNKLEKLLKDKEDSNIAESIGLMKKVYQIISGVCK